MNKQKGIAPILIIILIAVVGGYLIYQKQTKLSIVPQLITQSSPSPVASSVATSFAETANWKIYEDQENGFSFKYPSNWNIDNTYKSVNGSIRFFKVGDQVRHTYMMAKGNEQLIVTIKTDQSFDGLRQQLKLSSPSASIDGKQTLRYATGVYIELAPLNNRILSLYSAIYPNENLDQILSTFKFQ